MPNVVEIYPDREKVERDFTEQELRQREIDTLAYESKVTDEATKAQAKAALLERLGITADEAALLLS